MFKAVTQKKAFNPPSPDRTELKTKNMRTEPQPNPNLLCLLRTRTEPLHSMGRTRTQANPSSKGYFPSLFDFCCARAFEPDYQPSAAAHFTDIRQNLVFFFFGGGDKRSKRNISVMCDRISVCKL